jgi:hypothetical protein
MTGTSAARKRMTHYFVVSHMLLADTTKNSQAKLCKLTKPNPWMAGRACSTSLSVVGSAGAIPK